FFFVSSEIERVTSYEAVFVGHHTVRDGHAVPDPLILAHTFAPGNYLSAPAFCCWRSMSATTHSSRSSNTKCLTRVCPVLFWPQRHSSLCLDWCGQSVRLLVA